ncbi:hypothetical protein ACIGW4_31340 [Streptomyces sp. NPDC053513]|uniref:hypothetical protein n=1 Tax=unclassified Streptomyces TaxID=2593676 RepID=UPI0037D616B9
MGEPPRTSRPPSPVVRRGGSPWSRHRRAVAVTGANGTVLGHVTTEDVLDELVGPAAAL